MGKPGGLYVNAVAFSLSTAGKSRNLNETPKSLPPFFHSLPVTRYLSVILATSLNLDNVRLEVSVFNSKSIGE